MPVKLSPRPVGKLAEAEVGVCDYTALCLLSTSKVQIYHKEMTRVLAVVLHKRSRSPLVTSKSQVFVRCWAPEGTKQKRCLNSWDRFVGSETERGDSPGWEVNKPTMPFPLWLIHFPWTRDRPPTCLLEGIHATRQHVQVVQRCDRGGQVALGMI